MLNLGIHVEEFCVDSNYLIAYSEMKDAANSGAV